MRVVTAANRYLSDQEPWKRKDDPDRRDTILHTALQVVQDANTLLTPFLPHSAQQVHEALGGSGVWAAQPEIQEVDDLGDGPAYPVLTGDYAGEQARWASTPIEVGRPLAKPTPIFTKLDPELGETGPSGPRSPGERPPDPSERGVGQSTERTPRSLGAVTGAHGRRAGRSRPSRCGVPTVDAHTHLDACGCVDAADVAAAMDRAAAVGVTRAVTVADDLAERRAGSSRPRTGTTGSPPPSPCTRPARPPFTDDDLAEIERLAARPARRRGRRDRARLLLGLLAARDAQQRAFRWHIDLAKRLGKPLMIHDRDAHDDVLRDPATRRARPAAVVFHCFSGDAAMARTCVDAGYVLSFAGPVTFKNAAELREAAALVPDDQLLVETDAPFLTPHPHRGRANEPYCLPWTVRGVGRTSAASPPSGSPTAPGGPPSGCFGSASCRRSRTRPSPGARSRAFGVADPPFGAHGVSQFASDLSLAVTVLSSPSRGGKRSPAERSRWSGRSPVVRLRPP